MVKHNDRMRCRLNWWQYLMIMFITSVLLAPTVISRLDAAVLLGHALLGALNDLAAALVQAVNSVFNAFNIICWIVRVLVPIKFTMMMVDWLNGCSGAASTSVPSQQHAMVSDGANANEDNSDSKDDRSIATAATDCPHLGKKVRPRWRQSRMCTDREAAGSLRSTIPTIWIMKV